MDLDMIVFGEMSLRQILHISVAVVIGMLCFRIIKRLFFKKPVVLQHTVYFVCDHCSWQGHVSKFGSRCPKCNHAMGKAV